DRPGAAGLPGVAERLRSRVAVVRHGRQGDAGADVRFGRVGADAVDGRAEVERAVDRDAAGARRLVTRERHLDGGRLAGGDGERLRAAAAEGSVDGHGGDGDLE